MSPAPRGRAPLRDVAFRTALVLALATCLTFLALPVLAIFLAAPPGALLAGLADPATRDALRLSLLCSTAAVLLVVLVGTPAAYLLATRDFRGRRLAVAVLDLPLVLPPAVAGIALLAALGPRGLLGGPLGALGAQPVLTTGGVVLALAFVSAPFFLRQAQAAFAAVPAARLEAARVLGASPARVWLRVAVPAARGGLVAGVALAWGRALGEFGATLVFAGSFRGVTQTAPLAIYERLATDFDGALALAAVLVALSAAVLVVVGLAGDRPLLPR